MEKIMTLMISGLPCRKLGFKTPQRIYIFIGKAQLDILSYLQPKLNSLKCAHTYSSNGSLSLFFCTHGTNHYGQNCQISPRIVMFLILLRAIHFVNSVCTIFSLEKKDPPYQTFPSQPELLTLCRTVYKMNELQKTKAKTI